MAIKDAQVARRENQAREGENDMLRNELERCCGTRQANSQQQQPNDDGSSNSNDLLVLQSPCSSLSSRLSPRALLPSAATAAYPAVPLLSPREGTSMVGDLADQQSTSEGAKRESDDSPPTLPLVSSPPHLITDDVEYLQQVSHFPSELHYFALTSRCIKLF